MSEEIRKRDLFSIKELYDLFLRVLSVFFLAFAIRHWLMLVGFPDNSIRFDTMSYAWQIAIVTLSIMQPIAALGLWSKTRWGLTVWILTALGEVSMYSFFSGSFGTFVSVTLFHLGSIAVFVL